MKDWQADFRYKCLDANIKENQRVRPKRSLVGQHLRDYVSGIPTGSIRQGLIKEFFKQLNPVEGTVNLAVDGRWLWNTKDKDLQALIKSGFLVRSRESNGGRSMRTYLSWSGHG